MDLNSLKDLDPVKIFGEKESGEELWLMDPSDAYSPPAIDEVSYEEMNDAIKKLIDEHKEWLARYNGLDNRDDEARIVGLDNLGNVYVTGISTSLTTYIDYLTIKYNSTGVEQWTARYSYSSLAKEDSPKDMVVDGAGNCYITGMSKSDDNWAGFSTVKYNTSGTELWASRADLFHSEYPYGIALDNFGNVYVSGESHGDMYTIGYNSLGVELGNSRFTNPGLSQEFVSDIVVDTSSTGSPKVYVSGSSQNQFQDENNVVLKYSSITGIDEKDPVSVKSFNLAQNYPNPFNPSTKISYTIPERGNVSLKVFNLLGSQVAELVNGEIEAGSYDVTFNASNLPTGTYFYRLQTSSTLETKKMILIK